MKKRNLVLSLLLVSTILTSTLTPALAVEYGAELNPTETTYTQVFSDVPEDHWAFEMVMELEERGAINGYPDGKFYPDNTVNREAFSKIMVVAAGLTVSAVDSTVFSDVSADYWAAPYIVAAQSYMTAYQSSSGEWLFKPSDNALREDVAVAIVKLKGYDTRLADLSILTTMFSDVDTISTAAQPYVALAVENGLISGYTDGTFRGQATITRAEAATILWRAFQYGSDNKVIADDITEVVTTEDVEVEVESESTVAQEDVIPYVVETLATATVSDSILHMVMDDDNNIIFYDSSKNQIISLDSSTNKSEVLVDVSQATCTPSGVTYTDLDIGQVFWDDVEGRLLVIGTFKSVQANADGWAVSTGGVDSLSAIFVVNNGKVDYLWDGSVSGTAFETALSNGTYVMRSGTTRVGIYNLETNSNLDSIDVYYTKNSGYTQIESGIYRFAGDIELRNFQYDAAFNGGWDTIVSQSGTYFWNYNTVYQNNYFYNWYNKTITMYDLNGNYKTLINMNEDVLVKDFVALPYYPDNLFVTTDEGFIFYDEDAKVIRMMYPNPDA